MFSERTQVLLSPQQVEKLKRFATREGVSVGAVIREAIDQYVDPGPDSRERAARAINSMEMPVDDWPIMKLQITTSQLGSW